MQIRNSSQDILRGEVVTELVENILPFWLNNMCDEQFGGFYGRIDGKGCRHKEADKGAVLNARILWTFSSAYRVLRVKEYLDIATRAKEYLLEHFIDKEYGGVYWSLNYKGTPTNTKKQIYALGFAIYGLSEYHRATSDQSSLKAAVSLFEDIESHAYDPVHGGYFEAFDRNWSEIGDVRLSDKDENARKTMNTHLHILEPYTNLYRIWSSDRLASKIRDLVSIFTDKIYDKQTGHLGLFFGDNWSAQSSVVSYGHDIEAAWLINEAVLVLGDKQLIEQTSHIICRIAEASTEGLQEDGSLAYESDSQGVNYERHWWVQAENIVGQFDIFQHFSKLDSLQIAIKTWQYIKANLIDKDNGEWYWSINPDGTPNLKDDKAGFWKCPYHNARMCLELIERILK